MQERARFQSYDNDRFGAQKLGIEFAESKPLGIGPGQFEVLSPVSAHSTYIRAGAEQGLLGFLVVVVLLGGTLLVAANNVIMGRDTAGIGSIGLLAIWCGTLANSVFIDTLHWRHVFVFAGPDLVGLARGARDRLRRPREPACEDPCSRATPRSACRSGRSRWSGSRAGRARHARRSRCRA